MSKIRNDLERTIKTLGKTLAWVPSNELHALPAPRRLQRRAWRVWYNKAPHAIGWSKRHYVFHDWRYSFSFEDVNDKRYGPRIFVHVEFIFVRRTISSILGSMTQDTSCVVDFSWFQTGRSKVSSSDQEVLRDILAGIKKLREFNQHQNRILNSDPSASKHLYLKYREYAMSNS